MSGRGPLDSTAEATSISNGEPRRNNITGHRAGGPNLDLSPAVTLPATAPRLATALAGDLRLDVGVRADGECVIGQPDAAFHLTMEGEVLGSTQLALDDH